MSTTHTDEHGVATTRYGVHEYPGTPDSRYFFDGGECATWTQYDTSQDAWYFGVWVDVETRTILTYAEGDVSRVVCPTVETLRAELASMADFYGDPPPMAIGYDLDGTRTEYYDERPTA